MNSIEIKVPAMGESISEATIGAFLKVSGSFVKVDDELVELETDKVNQVLYAQQTGTVTWNIALGDTVKIGQVIGSIEVGKEAPSAKETSNIEASDQKSSNKKAQATTAIEKPEEKTEKSEEKEESKSLKKKETPIPEAPLNKPQASSNARFAKEQFLSEIKIEPPSKTKQQPVSTDTNLSTPPQSERNETRKKMSKVRKVIAERLVNVLQETAMLTTFNEVDMTKIMTLRDNYKDGFAKKYNARLGFMPFFVKAAISAMKAFPEINAYIDGEEIIYRNYYDIGIAVGTDKGLFVPVIRNCDKLSFAEIEQSMDAYATKAREGGLVPGDLQGGGFTITNGGVYGSLLSTPILNPPQCAILGMHKIMKRAVVVDDQIVIRQMMYLALSYDHRVIDGKEAVSFLVHIKNALEDPSRILIGV